MSADVILLSSHRRDHKPARCCACSPADDFLCYPHRLAELASRVEAAQAKVESFQFVDQGTFDRLTADVLAVLASITDECLPDERATR